MENQIKYKKTLTWAIFLGFVIILFGVVVYFYQQLSKSGTSSAQWGNGLSGYLFFVNNHSYLVGSLYGNEKVFGEKDFKKITGLPAIKAPLEMPLITKNQAKDITQNKLTEIISMYKEKITRLNQQDYISECMNHSSVKNNEGQNSEPAKIIPDQNYCQRHYESAKLLLENNYETFVKAICNEPFLVYSQKGMPAEYRIRCNDSENNLGLGASFTIGANTGSIIQVSPSQKIYDETSVLRGLSLVDSGNESFVLNEYIEQARFKLEKYLKENNIPGNISGGFYITEGGGPNFLYGQL